MIFALQISDQLHLPLSTQFQSEFIFSNLPKIADFWCFLKTGFIQRTTASISIAFMAISTVFSSGRLSF